LLQLCTQMHEYGEKPPWYSGNAWLHFSYTGQV